MQADIFDPVLFLVSFLVFMILFLGYAYINRFLWFQQDGTRVSDNWFTSFKARDIASGGWFHRFGRPVLVLVFLNLVATRIVLYFSIFSPFQLFIFIFVFYIPTSTILVIILTVILWRIHKQPKSYESEHPIIDPFPDADSG